MCSPCTFNSQPLCCDSQTANGPSYQGWVEMLAWCLLVLVLFGVEECKLFHAAEEIYDDMNLSYPLGEQDVSSFTSALSWAYCKFLLLFKRKPPSTITLTSSAYNCGHNIYFLPLALHPTLHGKKPLHLLSLYSNLKIMIGRTQSRLPSRLLHS